MNRLPAIAQQTTHYLCCRYLHFQWRWV